MPDDQQIQPLSKTALKREATHAQDIGRRLTKMKPEQLDQFELPDKLRSAINDYQRFPSHGAKKRQLQYIGKLMRHADLEAIDAHLADFDGQSAAVLSHFAKLERWRERLLTESDALTDFVADFPLVDRQRLRQLLKKTNASNESQRKTHERALFKFLRETTESDPED